MRSDRPASVARLAKLALFVALLGAAVLAVAGPGYRLGWWDLRVALQQLLRYGAYLGAVALALGLLALLLNPPRRSGRSFFVALLAVIGGGLVVGIPWQWQRIARQVPPIHDISTDTANPPTFQAIPAVRAAANAPNPLDYSAEVGAEQQRGYPDIGPLDLPIPPREAFDRALALARQRGWEIVSADASSGRIEATATTFWFGFEDDVVIRVTDRNGTSRIDMRSVSRVGRSDVGTNARRIREFFAELQR